MNGSPARLASSIGKKLIVALTGLALLLFLLAHLAGNLQVFAGQEALNAYSEGLRQLGPLLWVARVGLIAVALLHVVLSLQLAAESRAAGGRPYAVAGRVQTKLSTRSMVLTGVLILLFVLYHLAHYTWGLAHPEYSARHDAAGRHDVYSMVVGSFSQAWIAGPYVVAMLLMGLHVSHGASSFFQTLGWRHPRREKALALLGPVLGGLLAAGYIAIPVAVQLGVVALPAGVSFP
jgi:succinate dehydrogenase / fumarate reductase, cytochrome b subunit